MTFLIVDDNAGVRRLLRQAVHELATGIWECDDGAEALSSYCGHRPDVVLMDIRMPRVDGVAATREIRRVDPSARIVMVTDYDDDGLREAAAEAGACRYALKHDLLDLPRIVQLAVAETSGRR